VVVLTRLGYTARAPFGAIRIPSFGRPIFVADAHRDGQLFIVVRMKN
jgi:hypothetical protein